VQKRKYHQEDTINDPYSIFLEVLRIPKYSELSDTSIPEMPLGLLGVPSYARSNYVYSSPDQDLAIISLDGNSRYSIFAELLIKRGYKPITRDDLDTSAMDYGQDLMAVGFPIIAFDGVRNLSPEKAPWYSNFIFEPMVTFGKLAVPEIHHYYFIGDMTIAPGNSGGPIVSNNKLVGIVSQQGKLALENNTGNQVDTLFSRYPYVFAIKSNNIYSLLHEMQIKDEQNARKK
jgi:hypothetical protein